MEIEREVMQMVMVSEIRSMLLLSGRHGEGRGLRTLEGKRAAVRQVSWGRNHRGMIVGLLVLVR